MNNLAGDQSGKATMTTEKKPTVIKKYANRRLYHTGTSTYVTLEDLAKMVRSGGDFVVFDAKTGEDITRSVLTQIIFEEEARAGQALLPISFLRQLISFYGGNMEALVPSYLEFSLENFAREQQKLRERMAHSFEPAAAFHVMKEQARSNMSMFSEALKMFTPFAQQDGEKVPHQASASASAEAVDLEALKRQMADMQAKLDAIVKAKTD